MANLKGLIRIVAPLAALCAVLAGCGVGGTTTTAASTTPTASPTATPIPCATHATTTGVVWSQASDKQIHGSLAGAAPATLSAFAYPLTPAASGYTDFGPTQISLAPDGKHTAVLQTQIIPNSDAPPQFILFSVDTTTHAVTRIANVGTRADLAGWADTKTLLYTQSPFWPSHVATENLHFYDIAAHTDSTIAGVKGVAKAEVRCSTLYWSEYIPASGIGAEKLHRYNLTTHVEIGAPIDLGKAFRLPSEIAGPDSVTGGGDWEVSVDNTTLIWQRLDTVTVPSSGDVNIGASTYQKAAADGSGAVAILAGAPADAYTRIAYLSLAPATGFLAVSTGGLLLTYNPAVVGSMRSYTPNSTFSVAPVWLPDGNGFLADIYSLHSTGPVSDLYQYSVSGGLTGTLAHANASSADTLP
ncbi:MAG TPA: hypothetical protein VH393_13615 [Ktedonobacterales bacterium]|jgi:hypothetical protein